MVALLPTVPWQGQQDGSPTCGGRKGLSHTLFSVSSYQEGR